MPIIYENLLNFPIPETRQHLSKRDTILYALSVGLGQDPMDRRQLDFVDHHRDLRTLPTMAVVLGHPGFWLADPATGVDAVRVVHGEQRIELHRPLAGRGRGDRPHQRHRPRRQGGGEGRAALHGKELRLASGELLARTSSTTFLRGDGGFGGPSGPVRPPAPMPTARLT